MHCKFSPGSSHRGIRAEEPGLQRHLLSDAVLPVRSKSAPSHYWQTRVCSHLDVGIMACAREHSGNVLGLRRGPQWHKRQLEGPEKLCLIWTGLTHTALTGHLSPYAHLSVLTGHLSPYALPSLVLFSGLEWGWGRNKH